MTPLRALAPLCLAALLSACERPAPASAHQLRSRAAFELGCPPEQLELIRIDQTTGGVIGCGRRVVYVESCRGSQRCSWSFDREAPPAGWGAWTPAPASPRVSSVPVAEPPRASPYPPAALAPGDGAEGVPEWKERVPRLLRDDPGF
jgi:hypothetical protein